MRLLQRRIEVTAEVEVLPKLPVIRCSALPRIMECPASIERPEVLIDTSDPVAVMGTAAHAFYEVMVKDGLNTVDEELIGQLALKYEVDVDELTMLAWRGLKYWKRIKPKLEEIHAEEEVSARIGNTFMLVGHPDISALLTADPFIVPVLDWKAGYLEKNYTKQGKGYLLIRKKELEGFFSRHNLCAPKVKYRITFLFTRFSVVNTIEYTEEELDDFEGELMDIYTGDRDKYAPSTPTCLYCPHKFNCEPRRKWLEASGSDLRAILRMPPAEMTPAALASLYPQAQELERVVKHYKNTLKQLADEAGGVIECENGTLSLVDSSRSAIAWKPEIICNFVEDETFKTLRPTIAKGELKTAVMDFYQKGDKGAGLKRCMEALEEAGAVETTAFKKLEFKGK